MASSDLSDEDFLGSLGISLDDVDLTADADTHTSVTGIFAQDPYIKLDVGETSGTEISLEIFDQNNPVGAIINPSHLGYIRHFDVGRYSHKELLGALAERWKEKFNPSILKSLENMAHLAEYDWAGAILSRMYDDMCDLSRGHCKLSGTYYFWEVEVGAMAARLQSWIQVDSRFQRSDALSRRRVPIRSRVDSFQRSAPSQPPATHSSRASGPSSRTPWRRPTTDPSSSTPVEGPSRVGPSNSVGPFRAPRAISEATGPLHPGLANLRLPYSIPYYTPDGISALREIPLGNVNRMALPPKDITEVPVGLVNQMMELILGMQQELTSSWTLRAFDDQRRRRPRR
ncbi:hypothetical protein JCGZ_00093 [Jatropha curcas]|uniref:Aminotransferase-like plant mobile domain-containing protein n=1 Tax=Jatropha curcas TaxID=180498 RepID=A0A067LF73_JATCU|nr:hypothetical protein JCGZ_00093 [Jatropha curcas]